MYIHNVKFNNAHILTLYRTRVAPFAQVRNIVTLNPASCFGLNQYTIYSVVGGWLSDYCLGWQEQPSVDMHTHYTVSADST